MIKRLLVANRGEIAVRIMATASVLGIETVAVYPADDAACGHVGRADAAVELPGTGAAAYLDVDAIIAAATGSGCDTLHPGYGFLSERPELAARCAAAGLRFAGPGPEALALFGDKAATRARARELGVPVLAGTGVDPSPEQVRALLREHGAVMVKAVAGGGGRGLRPVTREEDLAEAQLAETMRRCASEAASAFGDGRVYAEQLLTGARHIEVQVLGDGTGAVAALGDRDCSLQRRRQKLVEIAPAALAGEVRARLSAAAAALVGSAGYAGLATAEFLVQDDEIAFLEVNPRLQVEHTVTEQVTGLDLVELGLRVADGATLAALALDTTPRGVAVQARVNAETLRPDGTLLPGDGTLSRFQPPAGRGVRVDTAGYPGYTVSPRYDSLLAKVITTGGTLEEAARRAVRALAEFDIAGVPVNTGLLQALLQAPGLGTLDVGWVDGHAAELAAAVSPAGPLSPATTPDEELPDGDAAVRAPLAGTVVAVAVAPGDPVSQGDELLVIEAMKMEHEVRAQAAGLVREVPAAVGATVAAGEVLVVLAESGADAAEQAPADDVPLDHVRPDLEEVRERHRIGLDEGRPEVTARRHATGRRTARENIADLADPGSFTEYGALTIAAQRRRRPLGDLIARTPADGLVLGTATVDGLPVAVMSYDYSVLAGTQGHMNHRKTDRLLELADRERLPLVMFAEGGGGRPGDTDTTSVAGLDVPTFRLTARLSGRVPLVAIVSGYCFAGNAALAGACDVIIATPEASLGMGGPAMIEGGGLGVVEPDAVRAHVNPGTERGGGSARPGRACRGGRGATLPLVFPPAGSAHHPRAHPWPSRARRPAGAPPPHPGEPGPQLRCAAGHRGAVRHRQRARTARRVRRRGGHRAGPPRRPRGRAAGEQPAAPGRGDRRRRRGQGHRVPAAVRGVPAARRLAGRHARVHGGPGGGTDGHRAALRRDVRGRRPAHRAGLRGGAAQGLRPGRDGDDSGRPAPPGHHRGLADRGVRRHGAGGGGAARLPQGTGGDRGPRRPPGALRRACRRAVRPRQGGQHRDGVRDRRRDRPGRHPRRAGRRAGPGRGRRLAAGLPGGGQSGGPGQRRMTGRIRRLG